jgi:hypothetical protein
LDGDRLFGASVSVVGSTALIGAPQDDDGGYVYVFARDKDGRWTARTPIRAPSGAGRFGDRIVSDAFSALIAGGNVVYYYTREKDDTWHLRQTIPAPVGSTTFSEGIALQGCEAMISSFEGPPGRPPTGAAVLLFNRCINGRWRQMQTIVPPDLDAGGAFGTSIAVRGDEMLIGAPLSERGAAYFYVRHNGRWIERQKLVTADADASLEFGAAVTFDEHSAVVGDPFFGWIGDPYFWNTGAAYVFTRTRGGWIEQERLQPQVDTAPEWGWSGYGQTLLLRNGLLIVGVPGDEGPDHLPGTISFYTHRRDGSFSFVGNVIEDGGDGGAFGASLSLSGPTLLVGAEAERFRAQSLFEGAAYFYTLP